MPEIAAGPGHHRQGVGLRQWRSRSRRGRHHRGAEHGAAFTSGQFNRVPVVIGNNLNEQTWFIGMNEVAAGEPLSAARYSDRIQASYGADASKVLAQYPPSEYANPSEALSAATTAAGFACGTRRAIWMFHQCT